MFLEWVAELMFALGCMSFGFFIGMQFSETLQRKDSADDVQDEEAEA